MFLEKWIQVKLKKWDLRCLIIQLVLEKKKIVNEYFEGISVIEQAQLLNKLLKRKCLRNAMTLLGIQNVKEAKSNEIVKQTVALVLASLAKKIS